MKIKYIYENVSSWLFDTDKYYKNAKYLFVVGSLFSLFVYFYSNLKFPKLFYNSNNPNNVRNKYVRYNL